MSARRTNATRLALIGPIEARPGAELGPIVTPENISTTFTSAGALKRPGAAGETPNQVALVL